MALTADPADVRQMGVATLERRPKAETLGGQIEVKGVSKSYGAAGFAKTVVERLHLYHRERQARP